MKPTFILCTLATLVSSLSLISAQTSTSIDGLNINLSASCENTLKGFLNNTSITSCIPVLQIGLYATSSNLSVPTNAQSALSPNTISAISGVVSAVCSTPKCSDSVVSSALSTYNSGFQSDLKQGNNVVLAIQGFIELYSPIRDSMCFKNSTGGYCVLQNVNIAQDLLKSSSSFSDVSASNVPAQDLCTTCNKAILNTMFNYENNHTNIVTGQALQDQNTFKNDVTTKCGASFLDGNVPTTSSGSNSSSNDASTYLLQNSMYLASLAILLVTYVIVF